MFEFFRTAYLWIYNKLNSAPTNEDLNEAASGLRSPEEGLETLRAGRGACLIIFPGGREDYCADGMTNDECKALAVKYHGNPRPVVPGSRCVQ